MLHRGEGSKGLDISTLNKGVVVMAVRLLPEK